MESRYVLLSGCSGGGKSTLLTELRRRGFTVVSEPGRRIVEAELRDGGGALPWIDLAAFAKRAMQMAADDRERVTGETGWVFFDRRLIDAAVALQHATGQPAEDLLASYSRHYRKIFLTPPWPQIFVTDRERRHDFSHEISEYDRLKQDMDLSLPMTSTVVQRSLTIAVGCGNVRTLIDELPCDFIGKT